MSGEKVLAGAGGTLQGRLRCDLDDSSQPGAPNGAPGLAKLPELWYAYPMPLGPDAPDRLVEANSPHGEASSPSRIYFTETQLDQIARMLVAGVSVYEIAATFRVSVGRIRRLDLHDPDMQDRKHRFSGEVTRQVVMTKFRMFEQLDRVVSILEQKGLHAPDDRTQLETAKWWFEKTVPDPKKENAHSGALELKLPDAVIESLVHMAQNDSNLREVQRAKPALLSRIRTNFDQLPSLVDPDPSHEDSATHKSVEANSGDSPDAA